MSDDNNTIRSEEHTSELQSLRHLVCRLLLEKKHRVWPQLPRGSNRRPHAPYAFCILHPVTLWIYRLLFDWPVGMCLLFFCNDTATTEIYTLSLHNALPISSPASAQADIASAIAPHLEHEQVVFLRSEEHTSELQSLRHLVCRLLLEKK